MGDPRLRIALEQHRVLRRILVRRFGGVVDVIEADGDRLRRIHDRRQVGDRVDRQPQLRTRARRARGCHSLVPLREERRERRRQPERRQVDHLLRDAKAEAGQVALPLERDEAHALLSLAAPARRAPVARD